MLIYGHLTPQKLIPLAKSRQYLIDHTDLCGLVDDPDFAVDIDTAINYNQAITGNPKSINIFLNGLFLSGHALDASTIQYYVRTCSNNPIFRPYIKDFNNNFYKKYSGITDCLTSPCNYFIPTSSNIGAIGDVASSLNYNTQPTTGITSLPAGFAVGMASLNKIPLSIQNSIGQLTGSTMNVFKTVMGVFTDPTTIKAQNAAIESGVPYRNGSISDIYTSDYMSYIHVSSAATDILGSISQGLGDCFRLYQQESRYNPFDYTQNNQIANKAGALTRVEKVYTSMGYNGVNLNGMGDYARSSNDTALTPFVSTSTDSQLQTSINGTSVKLYVTVFGGYYDKSNKTLFRDSSDSYNSSKGYEYYQNTQGGIGHRGGNFRFVPSIESALVRLVKGGYDYNMNLGTPTANKFNRGYATDKQTVYNYFALAGPQVDKSEINKAFASGTLLARINFNGKTFELPIIDSKGPSSKSHQGADYRVIDITADTMVDLYGVTLGPITSTSKAALDSTILTEIKNYISYSGAASPVADVQFIIKGVFEPSNTLGNEAVKPNNVSGYSNGNIPAEALTSIGSGHKMIGNAAAKYMEMAAAAKLDGITWGITDSYRSYEAQVDVAKRKGLYSEGGLAARPGTSNHGLGKALDLQLSTAAFQWLQTNAVKWQFYTIPRERWHWEYRGS